MKAVVNLEFAADSYSRAVFNGLAKVSLGGMAELQAMLSYACAFCIIHFFQEAICNFL